MKTETLILIVVGTVILSVIIPALFLPALIANTIIILVWLVGGKSGGGGSFDHFDDMGSGDSGGG